MNLHEKSSFFHVNSSNVDISVNSPGIRLDLRGAHRRFFIHQIVHIAAEIQSIAPAAQIDANANDFALAAPLENDAVFVGEYFLILAFTKYAVCAADLTQTRIMRVQFFINMLPVKTLAAERVGITLRSGFVPVIDAGNAEQREL